jgi:hypothetical protein
MVATNPTVAYLLAQQTYHFTPTVTSVSTTSNMRDKLYC